MKNLTKELNKNLTLEEKYELEELLGKIIIMNEIRNDLREFKDYLKTSTNDIYETDKNKQRKL